MSRYDVYGLTLRERDIYDYIIWFKSVNGYSPTLDEIAQGVITSRSFVRNVIYRLQEKGWLKYDENKRRSIVVLRNYNQVLHNDTS